MQPFFPEEVWEAADTAYCLAINAHMDGKDHIFHIADAIMEFKNVSDFPSSWKDAEGPLMVMCVYNDFLMVRRPQKHPFVISCDQLVANFEHFPLDTRKQVLQWVEMIKEANEKALKDLAHGE